MQEEPLICQCVDYNEYILLNILYIKYLVIIIHVREITLLIKRLFNFD